MRKDKEETLPDSAMTSQENGGSILDGTISESVEGNRTNLINQATDPRNLHSSHEVLDLEELLLILKIMNTISLR
ncbi:hypothetical protein HHI36_014353, partial [Cryptolaemus montrouzieri]